MTLNKATHIATLLCKNALVPDEDTRALNAVFSDVEYYLDKISHGIPLSDDNLTAIKTLLGRD